MKTKSRPRRTTSHASEIAELRSRLAAAEDTLEAIRKGEVDAVVISGSQRDEVFTLQSADKPYRLLIEAMNEGALTVLQDGTILYCNRRFADAVQRPIEQIIGDSLFHFLPAEQQPLLKQLLETLPSEGVKRSLNLGVPQHNGAGLPVQLSFSPLRIDGVKSVAVVATDLTERNHYEEALRQQNTDLERRVVERTAELTRANQALSEAQEDLRRHAQDLEKQVAQRTAELRETLKAMEGFCYTIAHDLRAPLRTIHGFTAALLEELGSNISPSGHDYGRRIVTASTRMDELIRDLLAYGRLTSADLPLIPTDSDRLMERAIAQTIDAKDNKDVTQPQITVQRPLPRVLANPTMLEQIFVNLLQNAVKFVSPGVSPQIEISAVSNSDRISIAIRDNGIGIVPEHFERIFRVFERLAPKEYPGTGIGLAIVQKGLERMGGEISVTSQPGKGSCFSIHLPKVPDEPDRKETSSTPELAGHPAG
jgi:PAS domain S-box-containing protein